MAKTVRTKVYRFDELDTPAQKKALDEYRYVEVEHDWWQGDYDYFAALMRTIGIEVDLKNTFFKGFASQGDGAAVTADVDLKKLVEGIAGKVWESEYGTNNTKELGFEECPVRPMVLKLLYNGQLEDTIEFKASTRFNYSTKLSFSYSLYDYDNIQPEVDKLEKWLEDIAQDVSSYLYRTLETTYDYLTSDEAVKESIISNEYWFTIDGKSYPC